MTIHLLLPMPGMIIFILSFLFMSAAVQQNNFRDRIRALKSKYLLSDVLKSYLTLLPTSKPDTFTALCPFHDDKNPSLHIDDQKGSFICFSCQAQGDMFDFVRLSENDCDFNHAVEKIDEVLGISNTEYSSLRISSRLLTLHSHLLLATVHKFNSTFFSAFVQLHFRPVSQVPATTQSQLLLNVLEDVKTYFQQRFLHVKSFYVKFA